MSKKLRSDKSFCDTCGKLASGSRRGSLTGWIFRDTRCQCASSALESQAVSVQPSAGLPAIHSRFRTLELLGAGGMGNVYKVEETATHQYFAVKVLNAEWSQDIEAVARLNREAQACMRMSHQNLVKVFEQATAVNGSPFIVMELLEGNNLLTHLILSSSKPNLMLSIQLLLQICDALVYVHSQGVIHRDLKPGNIMVVEENGVPIVKLLDFGIAQITSQQSREEQKLTQKGDVFGTPTYMSPEQCLGFALDERSDVYAFGCVMHEVFSGAAPFIGDNAIEVISKHLNHDTVRLENSWITSRSTRANIASVVNKCLHCDPEDRYLNAIEVKEELERLAKGMKPLAVEHLNLKQRVELGWVIWIGLLMLVLPAIFLSESDLLALLYVVPIVVTFVAGLKHFPGFTRLWTSIAHPMPLSDRARLWRQALLAFNMCFAPFLFLLAHMLNEPTHRTIAKNTFVGAFGVCVAAYLIRLIRRKSWRLYVMLFAYESVSVGVPCANYLLHGRWFDLLPYACLIVSLMFLALLVAVLRLCLVLSPGVFRQMQRNQWMGELLEFFDVAPRNKL